jgi:formate-dependent nitrite reductase membrane component NrfD
MPPEVETHVGAAPGSEREPAQRPWLSGRPIAAQEQQDEPSYYDLPMLKPHVWSEEVTWYFFLGGLSAGAYVLSRVAEHTGGSRYARLTRTAAYVAAGAVAPCAPLLILDLGDPARFHHMLRVWKPSSPMNLGSWILTAYTPIVLVAALREWARDGRTGLLADLIRRAEAPITLAADGLGVPLGFGLATYTGVLISATAAPAWCANPYLGALFTASAMSSGVAAVRFALAAGAEDDADDGMETALGHVATAAHLAEALALSAYGQHAGAQARPLTSGKLAAAFWGGVVGVGIALPVLLDAIPVPARAKRAMKIASSVATLVGGFALRWAMMKAGGISAADPQANRDATRLKNVTPKENTD